MGGRGGVAAAPRQINAGCGAKATTSDCNCGAHCHCIISVIRCVGNLERSDDCITRRNLRISHPLLAPRPGACFHGLGKPRPRSPSSGTGHMSCAAAMDRITMSTQGYFTTPQPYAAACSCATLATCTAAHLSWGSTPRSSSSRAMAWPASWRCGPGPSGRQAARHSGGLPSHALVGEEPARSSASTQPGWAVRWRETRDVKQRRRAMRMRGPGRARAGWDWSVEGRHWPERQARRGVRHRA